REGCRCRVAPRIYSKGAPTDPDAPDSGIRFLGLTVSLPVTIRHCRVNTFVNNSEFIRVSQWQFRKPTPPLATRRLPRVGFPAFWRYYEGATTSSVLFDGLIAFGHQYLLVLSWFAHASR